VTSIATDPRNWRTRAACREVDPDLFFPVGADDSPVTRFQVERARAVCDSCPVRADCLRFALGSRQDGIWGGTTEGERSAARQHLTRGAA
jgi:WhiB family transcriptional regulator, redox-sensing transcriptional regulator